MSTSVALQGSHAVPGGYGKLHAPTVLEARRIFALGKFLGGLEFVTKNGVWRLALGVQSIQNGLRQELSPSANSWRLVFKW